MKANIGVYTNPGHDLWTAPAKPDVRNVLDGSSLKPGEVTIGIKNTGICGYARPSNYSISQQIAF